MLLYIKNFEETINPNNFNYKINRLLYEFKNCGLLSDTVLMNIAKINPNELRLSKLSSILNIIRICSTLPDNMNVIFGENSCSTFSFKFFNSVILFKDGGKALKLYCKEICITPVDYKKESIMFLDSSTICLSKLLSMKLVYFKQTPEDTSFEPETISDLDSNFDSFCLIKITPKSEISLACFEFIELIANKDKKKYLAGISPLTKFIIMLCKMKDISNFSKAIKFAPNHTELEWKSETYSYIYNCNSFKKN